MTTIRRSLLPSLPALRRAMAVAQLGAIVFLLLRVSACFDLGSLQSGKQDASPVPDGGSIPSSDGGDDEMGQQPMPDMLFAWNPAEAPGPAPGCRSNLGWSLDRQTGKLFACVGAFNYPDGDKQCTAGFSMPRTLTIPREACAAVPWGFFAGGAHRLGMTRNPNATHQCHWEAPDATYSHAYREGCGPAGRAVNGNVYTFAISTDMQCGGFPVTAACTGLSGWMTAETPFNCDPPGNPYMESYFPMYTTLSRAQDGVLCAKP